MPSTLKIIPANQSTSKLVATGLHKIPIKVQHDLSFTTPVFYNQVPFMITFSSTDDL